MQKHWLLSVVVLVACTALAAAAPKLQSAGGAWQFYPAPAGDEALPRVLLVGDSITNGHRGQVSALLEGKARVDVWLTPLHLNSDPLLGDLRTVLAEGPYDVVHVNIGLHGWVEGRIPTGHYKNLLCDYLNAMRLAAPGTTPVWASSTPVTVQGKPTELNAEINPIIVERNRMAAEVMQAYGIAINDLYGTVSGKLELASGDRFHWQREGYRVMAEQVAGYVTDALAARGPRPLITWVAPNGDDANPGTEQEPFRTLERARDEIRRVRGTRTAHRAEVRLRDGLYRVTHTLELDARDSHTVYRSVSDGGARLIGGVLIPAESATPVRNKAVLARIVEEDARAGLRQIDLRALGITDFGELGPRGFRRAYKPAPLELFIDGVPQQIARWPNAGEARIPLGKVIDPGSKPRQGDYSFRPGTFEYGVDRAERWAAAGDLYVSGIFCYGFADDTIKVASIDTEKQTFTTTHPHIYGFTKRSFCSWYALNLIEEIDRPGEYCVDKESGVLYFLPPPQFRGESEMLVSMLEAPMVAIEGAVGVRLEGIAFEASRGTGVTVERGARNLIADCEFRNLGIVAVQIGQGIKPFPYGKHDGCGNQASGEDGEPVSRELGSWHEHIYKHTAWDREAGVGHAVVACDIRDTGAGGVSLGGGNRKTLTPGANVVHNCDISRVNRWDWTYKAPVNIDGAGNRVTHCRLHHCPGIAVYLHGNDHVIAFNEMDNVLTDMSDMGAIYMGRDPSETGNVFRHNYFHDIRNYHRGGHGVQAIFFDDCSICGAEIVGNLFRNAGSTAAIKFNGGGACRIENNVFMDCPRPFQGAGDNTRRVRGFMSGALGKQRLRERVDITVPPYSVKYADLLAIYQGKQPVKTTPERNYVVKGYYAAFADAASGDYSLLPGSPVFSQIPGFEPVPFDQMGLITDRFRRSLPVTAPSFGTAAQVFVGQTSVAISAPRKAAAVVYTLDGSDPVLESPRYTKPIVLDRSTTIRARAIGPGDVPELSEEAVLRIERIEAKTITAVQVNFQPDDGNTPEGWLPDTGAAFALRDSGYVYGWTRTNTDAARRRGRSKDALDDTLLHFSGDAGWEIAVPNGGYELTVRVGDSQHPCAKQTIHVEGNSLVAGLNLKGGEFRTIAQRVQVTDGALTLTSRNVPHGPELTRINWLRLRRAEE